MSHILPKPALKAKTLGKVFKASGGGIKLTKGEKSIQFLFEVIRREDDWQNKLTDKIRMYKDFYENFVPGDCGYTALPQLIIVCEDEKHIAEAFKHIVINKLEIDKINLYFTTDLKQNSDTLEDTLISIKLDPDTQKYQMVTEKIKLLS